MSIEFVAFLLLSVSALSTFGTTRVCKRLARIDADTEQSV